MPWLFESISVVFTLLSYYTVPDLLSDILVSFIALLHFLFFNLFPDVNNLLFEQSQGLIWSLTLCYLVLHVWWLIILFPSLSSTNLERHDSEFWNRDDEASLSDEDISASDGNSLSHDLLRIIRHNVTCVSNKLLKLQMKWSCKAVCPDQNCHQKSDWMKRLKFCSVLKNFIIEMGIQTNRYCCTAALFVRRKKIFF